MWNEIKNIGEALKRSFRLLKQQDPLMLSSSTAFFATFSLSPIIIILVSIFGLYFKSDRFTNQLFHTIGSAVGAQTARDIHTIVDNFIAIRGNWAITIASTVFFAFVATTLLGVVKRAIQKIWHIKSRPVKPVQFYSRERLTQVAFILFTGVLFLVSLFMDTTLSVSLDYLQSVWPKAVIILLRYFGVAFSVIMIILWFTVLFKVLTEAQVTWNTAFSGGFLTGILFSLGKLTMGKLLIHARIATIFGASASIALLLLFIFYSSFILYYGVAFTYEYGAMDDQPICAGKYAVEYEERIIENNDSDPSQPAVDRN